MNREEIMEFLPHRAPMLLVDDAIVEDDAAVGHYTVRGDEFFLQGHFPGNPVVPGVMLCEMMGQCAAVLLAHQMAGKTPYFAGLDQVRFRRPVKVGDTIEFISRMTKHKAAFYFLDGTGRVGDQVCVTGQFSFALMP